MRLTKENYERYVNDLPVPPDELKSNGGRIPDGAAYGTWLRRNDSIAFNIGYQEWVREAQFREGGAS